MGSAQVVLARPKIDDLKLSVGIGSDVRVEAPTHRSAVAPSHGNRSAFDWGALRIQNPPGNGFELCRRSRCGEVDFQPTGSERVLPEVSSTRREARMGR